MAQTKNLGRQRPQDGVSFLHKLFREEIKLSLKIMKEYKSTQKLSKKSRKEEKEGSIQLEELYGAVDQSFLTGIDAKYRSCTLIFPT